MHIVCLDLEGVLIPEIWISVAKRTGIAELELTTRDVPDYALVVGNPGRIAGWMCECGVKLASGSAPPARARCTVCHTEYSFDAHALRRVQEISLRRNKVRTRLASCEHDVLIHLVDPGQSVQQIP